MGAFRKIAGRIGRKRAVAGAALAASLGAMLFATEMPGGLVSAGGSTALAELVARSPGARIGGVALKAKDRRAALAPATAAAAPAAEEAPENAFASVLGASAGPEGAIPATGPIGPGGFPSDFTAPPAPGLTTPTNGVSGPGAGGSGGSGSSSPPFFGDFSPPSSGGPSLIAPGPGSGSGPNTGLPPPVPQPTSTVPVDVPGIPEPSTWLMLIAGFGAIGHAMRRRMRAAIA